MLELVLKRTTCQNPSTKITSDYVRRNTENKTIDY